MVAPGSLPSIIHAGPEELNISTSTAPALDRERAAIERSDPSALLSLRLQPAVATSMSVALLLLSNVAEGAVVPLVGAVAAVVAAKEDELHGGRPHVFGQYWCCPRTPHSDMALKMAHVTCAPYACARPAASSVHDVALADEDVWHVSPV